MTEKIKKEDKKMDRSDYYMAQPGDFVFKKTSENKGKE